jgi:hypothetical protein
MSGAADTSSIKDVFRKSEMRVLRWRVASIKEAEFAAPVKCWQGCDFEGRFEDLMVSAEKCI